MQSFLISVSSFFRDPSVFETLTEQLRLLLASKQTNDSIRIWIPGCATGEEVYSVAILLAEILAKRLDQFDARIFATDIDRFGLECARAGLYSSSAVKSLEQSRRRQWFTHEGGGWRIAKKLRELCVFSIHDVIAHPPFIKMDLISCRNLLIYLKPEQQSELLLTFHYALNQGGLLLLGNSESAGFNSRLFEPIDPEHRLYRRLDGTHNHPVRFAKLVSPYSARHPHLPKSDITLRRSSLIEVSLELIAKSYAPPVVLVNEKFEPIHFFGGAQRYFALAQDSVDFSVFALCLPELRSGNQILVRLRLQRVRHSAESKDFALLICFEETSPALESIPDTKLDRLETNQTKRLCKELADTREHLQAVIEELETSNEELQSLNEEVQSSSEELQASNEELQASNEELTTLNDELRAKSQEANDLNATLSNIQNSISTGLVVIDRDGRITRYNALATRIFGIVANDIGQSLYGVPCHLNLPRLREQVAGIMASGNSIVERVHQGAFHFIMQLDPYRLDAGGSTGVVLTFVDISDLYNAEQAQKSSEIRFHQVWESCLEGLLVVGKDGRIVMVNPALQSMFGYQEDELLGQPIEILVPDSFRERHMADREIFMLDPQARQMGRMRDVIGKRKDDREFFIEVSLSSMIVASEKYVLATVSDISLRKKTETALRLSEQRLRLALDAANAGTWEWHLHSNENIWSDEIWKLYGLAEKSVAPSFDAWKECIHANDRTRVLAIIADAVADGSEFEFDWQVSLADNENPRWLFCRGRPILDVDGKPTRYIGIVLDISERKQAEVELEQHRNELERLVEQRT
ncbi:MAG: CheR family methyltransferase, partial [Methylomonas sp.]